MLCQFQRSSLIEALKSVQIDSSELKQLTSLTSVQTKGLKRHFHELKFGIPHTKTLSANTVEDGVFVKNTYSGVKRKRLDETDDDESDEEDKIKKEKDYNVVTLEESSSESENDLDIEPLENTKSISGESYDDGITVSRKIQEKNEKLEKIKKAEQELEKNEITITKEIQI